MSSAARLPVRRILRAIENAAARWQNADFAPRVRVTKALIERTTYSEPVIDFALDRMFESCTARAMSAVIIRELGSLDILDGFVAQDSSRALFARGVDRISILSSQTTIGVALPAALFALAANARVMVKDRADGLITAFFATVIAEEPSLADRALASAWQPSDGYDFSNDDVVVVFGTDATIENVRAQLPARATCIGYGSRLSAGMIDLRFALGETGWRAEAARDLVLYETEGCLSLHLLFVLSGDAPEAAPRLAELAKALLTAAEMAAIEFPAAQYGAQTARQLARVRKELRFAAAGAPRYFAEGSTAAVVVAGELPPALVPRTLSIIPCENADVATRYLSAWKIQLAGLSFAAGDNLTKASLAQIRSPRFAPFGTLQTPALASPHDGRPRIADYIRYIAQETAPARS